MVGIIRTLRRHSSFAQYCKTSARTFHYLEANLQTRLFNSTARDDGEQLREEQALMRNEGKRFYPVRIGELLHDRYRIITKLGFGGFSTVWLARDQK